MTKVEQQPIFDQVTSLPKLIFLAVMSVALCSFGPMSVFAPVPLTVTFLLYGRLTAFLTGLITVGAMIGVAVTWKVVSIYSVGIYAMAFLFALLVSEVFRRDIAPIKGLVRTGLVLVVLLGAITIGVDRTGKEPLKVVITNSVTSLMEEVKKQSVATSDMNEEDKQAFEGLVNNPKAIADEVYTSVPMIVVIYTFFVLWVTIYVALRNALVWKIKVPYSYTLLDFVNFKTPDWLVYPVILSIALWLGADYGLTPIAEIVGKNLLYSIAVFYFFQGFGVYNALLKHLKINGFVKTLFIAFTVLMAARFLALVGLFDLWFDFRKFFKNKKKDEGDTI